MDRPAISVIVPTHNGADRIRRLLDSIVAQSFTDYELIVICDRCTDGTADVARGYWATVIEGDFGCDGLARNAGLDVARGEWILFADDDDWYLHEYCFGLVREYAELNDPDVLDFSFIWHGKGYMKPSRDAFYTMVWGRMWKRDFIGQNRFSNVPYGSDTEFAQKMIVQNPDVKVAYLDTPIYYYNYLREGSMTWTKKAKKTLDIIITHFNEPWNIGEKMFDMLEHQQCAEMDEVSVTLVQDGPDGALDWAHLLEGYSYSVNTLTLAEHGGPAVARNAGIAATSGDWIMFCDFDDMFGDVSALNVILRNFPTDEYDMIWMKYAKMSKFRKGEAYINTITDATLESTDGKLYRRAMLDEKRLRFNPRAGFHYQFVFNAMIVETIPPFRIPTLTADFFPYFRTLREDGWSHRERNFMELNKTVFTRDKLLADAFQIAGNSQSMMKFAASAVADVYFTIYDPEQEEEPELPEGFTDFYRKFRQLIREMSQTELDVILHYAESDATNRIQLFYNEHRKEYYFLNDDISFTEWMDKLDGNNGMAEGVARIETEDGPVDVYGTVEETDPSKQKVVVYCGTYNVYLNMVASVKSLLCTTPVDKVYFLIEDNVFPYELPDIVECINVKHQKWLKPDGPNFDNSWTWMCMIRAAYPEIFPQYDKILSLDCDIVIQEDVSELWDYDMTDYYLAGVPERQRQKSSSDPLYINFGVVMMNLKKLREDGVYREVIEGLNTKKFDCPEQSAYNKYCAGKILDIPNDYNVTVYSHITGEAMHERILHYAGQQFWRHYSAVKKFSGRSWDEVIKMQEALHEG